MDQNRREFVKIGGVLGLMAAAGLLTAEEAYAQQQAWNKAAFEAKSVDETVKALGGTLCLVAQFPDRPPVVLAGIAEHDPPPRPGGRKSTD